MLDGILAELAQEEFASCISVDPIEEPPRERLLSVKETLEGDAVVFVPTDEGLRADQASFPALW